MNVATLRLSGIDAALDALVIALKLPVTSRVRVGDPRRVGDVHTSSGLSADIADGDNPGAMLAKVRSFLAECQKHGSELFQNGVEAELAIGVSVGDTAQYIASVDFSASEIRALANIGIGLSFAAYPTSDEANASADGA